MNDCVNNSTAAIVITAENYFSYQTNHIILFHFSSMYSQVHIGHQLYRIFQMFGQLNAAHLSMLDLGCYVKIKKNVFNTVTQKKIEDTKLEIKGRKSKTHRQIIKKPTEQQTTNDLQYILLFLLWSLCCLSFTLRLNKSDTRIVGQD